MADACVGRGTVRPRRYQTSSSAPLSEPFANTHFWGPLRLRLTARPRQVGRGWVYAKSPESRLTYPRVRTASAHRSSHAVSFRCCSAKLRINPDRAYLRLFIQGEADPCLGLGSVPKPPSRVPVFAFLYRGKTDPCLRCAPRFPRRKSGYPPALPVSLLPSFLNEGEADPCWRCAPVFLPWKEVGYPLPLPVSLPPSFYTRGKANPCFR